jgi:uncharacterized protein involved in exopolysaccharide biosynthesis
LLDWAIHVAGRLRWLGAAALLGGCIGYAVALVLPPIFTARASLLPPQQNQSAASGALAALGGLSVLAGSVAGIKTPADQYLSLLRSVRVADRIIDVFDLMKVYGARSKQDARTMLERKTRLGTERKETLITIEVDDVDPARAAGIANRYVEELRTLASQLTLTEAQQRRAFFERQLEATRERLASAQKSLQASGFNAGALRAEPRAAAEAYARLKAEATQAEVQLQALRRGLTDEVPEVQRQIALLGALRSQLADVERARPSSDEADYVGRFREYKYQEAMFEIFSRQYETARLDESREGTLIQVIDPATPPEERSRPKRSLVAALSSLTASLIVLLGLSAGHALRVARRDPAVATKLDHLGRVASFRG